MDREIMARRQRAARFAKRQARRPIVRPVSVEMPERLGRSATNRSVSHRTNVSERFASKLATEAEQKLRDIANGTTPLGPLIAKPAGEYFRAWFWPTANKDDGLPWRYESTCGLHAALMAIQDELAVRVAHRLWLREATVEAFGEHKLRRTQACLA